MATTGCGSITLASRRQLHALEPGGCRSASSTLLPHPCKMGSLVFFVFLPPIRLNLITCNKQRLPLSPPLCGRGDLEIVSVKELADGFLHFSFGVPSNVSASSKVEELSSSCGEHLAGKLSVPHRLPSKFSKKSPIPVAAVRRRKQQGGENPPKQGVADSTSSSVKNPIASSLRPKSYFVKRSPIPMRRSVQSLQSESVLNEANSQHKSEPMRQGTQIGSLKGGISKRPPSAFVRKLPISRRVPHAESVSPSSNPDTLSNKAGNTAVRSHRNSVVGEASRPKSVFSRRSPIVRAHKLLPSEASTNNALQQGHKSSSHVGDASQISSTISPESSSEENVDLHKCKLAELKNLAKTKGLKGYSKLKKGELLDLLQNLES